MTPSQNIDCSFLRCPLTRQSLREATPEEIQAAGISMDQAMVSSDGKVFYPVRSGIPLLIASEARTSAKASISA